MTLRIVLFLASVLLVISVAAVLLAAEWYVAPPPLGKNKNPGTEEGPFATIQVGINIATDGDTVIVAVGTYVENVHLNGKNIVLTSTDPLDHDIVAGTIIDGNEAGSVVSFLGTETEACVFSGFTIQNGRADFGAGISGYPNWLGHSHATIQNNTITRNAATLQGGGLSNCAGMIENNTINGNSAGQSGGGLASCNGTIQSNTITGNRADCGGGLASCNGTIQNNMIAGNSAFGGGGLQSCHGTIWNNTITGNSAGVGGGLDECHGTIDNNTITANSALSGSSGGGALAFCNGTVLSNTIAGNSAPSFSGGGVYACGGPILNNAITGNSAIWGGGLRDCTSAIVNNTIAGNSAAGHAGGLFNCEGKILNCAIWGNTAPTDPQLYECFSPGYSCIEGWSGGGTSNISLDPHFVDPDGLDDDPETYEDNDYRLSADSPCIDMGDNSALDPPGLDKDGNLRIAFGRNSVTVDMGAYEYNAAAFLVRELLILPGSTVLRLTWNSHPNDAYTVWSSTDPTASGWEPEAIVFSKGQATSWLWMVSGEAARFFRVEIRHASPM